MYFPRYWEREEHEGFVGWGFSDENREEARVRAQERAQMIAERFQSGEPLGRYGYPDRPVREPILQSIASANGIASGVITRNSYGCVVLNAAEMFIADIDLPAEEPKKPSRGILLGLFGAEKGALEVKTNQDERVALARERVHQVVESMGLTFVYQTAGGLRVILADRKVDPSSDEASRLLEQMGSDPLYVRLCRNQKSFRARLTPKPWRCGYQAPPVRWPFPDAKSQESFKAWEDEYHRRIGAYSVSRLLELWGDGKLHSDIAPLLALHDQFSRADRTDLRLA